MASRVYVERASPESVMEEVKRTINWETFIEFCRAGFGVTILIMLIFINSDIHKLVGCLMATPIDRVTLAPPSVNCTSANIGHDLNIRVDLCVPPTVAVYVNNSILRSYSGPDADALLEWINRCYRTSYLKACPVYSTPTCPHYVPHSDAGICYYNNLFAYIVLGGFRFSRNESLDLITFLTSA
jgi:hypothetical protein